MATAPGKKGSTRSAKPMLPKPTGRIVSVMITWCSHDKQLHEIDVDLSQSAGFMWSATGPIQPIGANPGKGRLQGKAKALGTACSVSAFTGPGDLCCWWDGSTSQWVCPDEPQ